MKWRFEQAAEAFPRRRGEWDALNRARGNHALLDGDFVGSLLRHFGHGRVLLGESADPERPGMALVEPGRPGFWRTFQPSQAPLGLFLLGVGQSPVAQASSLLRGLPGYALGFSVLQQDPDVTVFAGPIHDPAIETLDYIPTARLRKQGTFESYWSTRGKNLTHNLSRQRRKLTAQNAALDVSIHTDPAEAAESVREYGRLESAGWKAGLGTAISADNQQGRFYREVLETYGRRGEAIAYRLLLNGATIASDLCLVRGGTMFVLKTAYDEGVPGLSPGLLLHQEIFRRFYEDENLHTIEFYGRVRDWHLKWTDEVRTMFHVNCYRHPWILGARRLLKSLARGTAPGRP